jgi:surface protein
MFEGCINLTSVNVGDFDTSNVTTMYKMFYGCESLTSIDVSNFDISSIFIDWNNPDGPHGFNNMFSGCSSLEYVNLSNWNTENLYVRYMFVGCDSLHTLRLDNCNNATISMIINSGLFPVGDSILGITGTIYCEEEDAIGLTPPAGWIFNHITDKEYKFIKDTEVTYVTKDMIEITSEYTDLSSMFSGCINLLEVDSSNWDTSNVIRMENMFYNCKALTTVDLSALDTSNVTHMYNIFNNCTSLASIDLSGFSISDTTSITGMFYKCTSLHILYLNDCDVNTVSKIIDSKTTYLPTGTINGEARKIYCSTDVANSLTEPDGWEFVTA